MLAKILIKETDAPNEKGFTTTYYLSIMSKDAEKIFCDGCGQKINHGEWIWLCADLNRVWHFDHYDQTHSKRNFIIKGNTSDHLDYLMIFKFFDVEKFNQISNCQEWILKI